MNKRVEVFQDFMSSEKFKDLSLDGDKQDVLIKVTVSVTDPVPMRILSLVRSGSG